MRRIAIVILALLGLAVACTSTGGTDRGRGPEVSGSEAIVAGGADVLAYVTVGGVT